MRSLSFRFAWISLLAGACSLTACGGSHDELTKRLSSMQTDLTRLQNHSDRLEERLETLEMSRKAEAAQARPVASAAPTVERPPLKIVKLSPGDETHSEVPADAPTSELRPEDSVTDQTPRPVIRVHGTRNDGDVKLANDTDMSPSDAPRHKRRGE